jgi:hypothetical protein
MNKKNIITNKYFLYYTGALVGYNSIELLFNLQKYPSNFFLYSTIGFATILFLIIRKILIEDNFLPSKITVFVLLALFLQSQISKINFLPTTAIYYSRDYDDWTSEFGVSTQTIKTVCVKTNKLNCKAKEKIIYNTENQPIETWECLSCDDFIAGEIDKILKPKIYDDNDDILYEVSSCFLKFRYFIFSGTAVINGYTNISSEQDHPFYQFIQYQSEAIIFISLSIALVHLFSFLSKIFKKRQKTH